MRLKVGGTLALRWLYRETVGAVDLRLSNAGVWPVMYNEEMGPSPGLPGEPRKGLWKGIAVRSGPCKEVLAAPWAGTSVGMSCRIASTSTRFSGQATPGLERVGRDGEVRILGVSGWEGFRRNENMARRKESVGRRENRKLRDGVSNDGPNHHRSRELINSPRRARVFQLLLKNYAFIQEKRNSLQSCMYRN
jgi:hypothetical protein